MNITDEQPIASTNSIEVINELVEAIIQLADDSVESPNAVKSLRIALRNALPYLRAELADELTTKQLARQ